MEEKKCYLTLITDGKPKALYKCECGNVKWINKYNVTMGYTRSCGCLTKIHPNHTIHGGRGTRLYGIWKSMRERCNTSSCNSYKNYGGRGIKICDEWDNFAVFREWALGAGYTDSLTIDRIDVNGNYEPDNCRWADYKTQANNTRANRLLTLNGVTKTMTQWADITGIKAATIHARLKRGWSVERALSKL